MGFYYQNVNLANKTLQSKLNSCGELPQFMVEFSLTRQIEFLEFSVKGKATTKLKTAFLLTLNY